MGEHSGTHRARRQAERDGFRCALPNLRFYEPNSRTAAWLQDWRTPDASTHLDHLRDRDHVRLRAGIRPDLRSELPGLHASLPKGWQLHCLRFYFDGSMPGVGIGPGRPMPRQSILCTGTKLETPHPLGAVPDGQIRPILRFGNYPACPAPAPKIFLFRIFGNRGLTLLVPFRHKGRTRRHERGAECDGRGLCRVTYGTVADGEVVWSWRAHAGAKFSLTLQRRAKMTVATRGSPGRTRISRKPSRREGRSVSACTCGHRALAQISLRGGPGCSATRLSLRPRLLAEGDQDAKLG
jgi:hypothetical protein